MQLPNWETVKQTARARLQRDLPTQLTYHAIRHTMEDVLPAAERLATLAGVDGEALLLLRTAAVYHDIGYTEQYFSNEPIAVRIAYEVLPAFGFSPAQLTVIEGLILATRMPQCPQTPLEELLCDADMDSLGRDDYWATSLALREELSRQLVVVELPVWIARQHTFLSGHTYFTTAARQLRDAKKAENIAMLKGWMDNGYREA